MLSALPLVNCCCLLWLGGGGLLAVYLLRQDFAGEIAGGSGGEGGLSCRDDRCAILADSGIADFLHHQPQQRTEQIQQFLQNQNFPAETMQIVEKVLSLVADPFNPFVLLVGLIFKGVACGILTTLGGVVGAAFWGKPKNQIESRECVRSPNILLHRSAK